MKIIFAGGGTGGHIFPSLAIANNLKSKNKNFEALFLISKNNLDEEILKKNNLNSKNFFNYKKISSGKLRRYFDLKSVFENFFDIFKFIFGFFQSLKIILKFKPDLIFCKGGFVSLPIALAGKILGKKIILHESDSVMGLANKIISKFCIGKNGKIFYGEKIGNPINFNGKKFDDLSQAKKNFRKKMGFDENQKILFASGGSQGAEQINNLIGKNLSKILKNFVVIHLLGKGKKENFLTSIDDKKFLEKNLKKYISFEFLESNEYFDFLQISDLVISRAGAGSISEILFFQKLSILIPLIGSAGEHQLKNAEKLEKNNLAKIFVDDGKILPNYEKFLELLKFDFSEIKNNLKKKNFQNPAKIIAEKINDTL